MLIAIHNEYNIIFVGYKLCSLSLKKLWQVLDIWPAEISSYYYFYLTCSNLQQPLFQDPQYCKLHQWMVHKYKWNPKILHSYSRYITSDDQSINMIFSRLRFLFMIMIDMTWPIFHKNFNCFCYDNKFICINKKKTICQLWIKNL